MDSHHRPDDLQSPTLLLSYRFFIYKLTSVGFDPTTSGLWDLRDSASPRCFVCMSLRPESNKQPKELQSSALPIELRRVLLHRVRFELTRISAENLKFSSLTSSDICALRPLWESNPLSGHDFGDRDWTCDLKLRGFPLFLFLSYAEFAKASCGDWRRKVRKLRW